MDKNRKKSVLIDTNVILDFMLERDNYAMAAKVIDIAVSNEAMEYLAVPSITNINYLVKKYSSPRKDVFDVQRQIRDILSIMDILPTGRQDIMDALDLHWHDFEDALQYSIAIANHCDCIVTNNVKDFENPAIEVLTPQDFLAKYFKC